MKLSTYLCAATLAAAAFLAPAASAQLILAVDFNQENNDVVSPTESGFSSYILDRNVSPSTPASQAFGPYTVAFNSVSGGGPQMTGSNLTVRDRGSIAEGGSFTNGDLLRDLAGQLTRRDAGAGNALTSAPSADAFTVSGLTIGQQYEIRLWSHNKDNDSGFINAWYDRTTGTSVLIGGIENISVPTYSNFDNNFQSVAGLVTAVDNGSGSGIIRLGLSVSGGTGALNGFTLTLVPEPGTGALLLGALGAFALIRRRRVR